MKNYFVSLAVLFSVSGFTSENVIVEFPEQKAHHAYLFARATPFFPELGVGMRTRNYASNTGSDIRLSTNAEFIELEYSLLKYTRPDVNSFYNGLGIGAAAAIGYVGGVSRLDYVFGYEHTGGHPKFIQVDVNLLPAMPLLIAGGAIESAVGGLLLLSLDIGF